MAAAAHFLIRKRLFISKYMPLLVAKDFAVAEKKLHLTISGRKYDPGKKASKRKHTSEKTTADPKPSTSQDQPQDTPGSEQKPQDEPASEEQPQDVFMSEQEPQEESTSEQQPQGMSATEEQQRDVPEPDTLSSHSSSDDLPDYSSTFKKFSTKDPSSIPKKPRYSPKTIIIQVLNQFYCLLFSLFRICKEKTNYFWTCNIFELSANMPKFIFSFKCNVILYQLFFKADAVKVLPQHYDSYIYFLFTALSQFDKCYFLLQYQSDIQLTAPCFFSSLH